LHQVGLLFNVNYDARNHELKKKRLHLFANDWYKIRHSRRKNS